jgi:hypothetical protein
MGIAGTVPSRASVGASGRRRKSDSVTGVLIFCGIGFGLSLVAAFIHWLELPPPMF